MKLQALTPPTPLFFFFFFFTTLLFYPTESTQHPYACDSSQQSASSYPFCKTALPINRRVQDLVLRLTLDEKISQLLTRPLRFPDSASRVTSGGPRHSTASPTSAKESIFTAPFLTPPASLKSSSPTVADPGLSGEGVTV
ncbi:unnamed protein product [Prunus armeniaca]|uniref:Uncharacterized protein n=1 Tax=Prunus armeniaca TaxID=36596 RepID=A0A6J5TUB7_PRUAR|nr:unnamed protein product [Prunus armeniaca]